LIFELYGRTTENRISQSSLSHYFKKNKRDLRITNKIHNSRPDPLPVLEFTSEVKEGFLKYKSAMEKAKELDEEITRIDRAIDRFVYDLYGLTEDETKVVEKSVWGEKFEEMYGKLPSRDSALRFADEVKEDV